MNRLDVFLSNKYDDKVALLDKEKAITYAELKQYISFKADEFKANFTKNVVLLSGNHFEFAVNFWAAVFAQKNIYLVSDEKRLKQLEVDYFLPSEKYLLADKGIEITAAENTEVNFFTSGSTGTPKLIRKDLNIIVTEAFDIINEFEEHFKADGTILTTSTPTHMFVLTFYFLITFCRKSALNCLKIQYPEQLENLKSNNNILITSPAFLNSLKKYDVILPPNIKTIFCAGSKLALSTQEYFEKQHINVIDIWGSTETGDIAYRLNSKEMNYTRFQKVELKKTEKNTIIKSPYFLEKELLLSDNIDVLQNGKLKLLARADRLVKINDKRVSLIELEEQLKTSEYINDVFCMEYDKKLSASVVLSEAGIEFCLKNGIAQTKKTLKNFLSNHFDIVPTKWIFLPQLPINERGKIDVENLKRTLGTKISLPLVLKNELSQNEIKLELIFPKTSNFLEGHFKIAPIVPGVVQLYFAKKFAQDFFEEDIIVWQIKRIKFSSVILPERKTILKLKNTDNSITFEYLTENEDLLSSGSFAKLKGQLK